MLILEGRNQRLCLSPVTGFCKGAKDLKSKQQKTIKSFNHLKNLKQNKTRSFDRKKEENIWRGLTFFQQSKTFAISFQTTLSFQIPFLC